MRYTVKIGAVLLILMGVMTLTGRMNGVTNYLSSPGSTASQISSQNQASSGTVSSEDSSSEAVSSGTESKQASNVYPAPDFTLVDQFGNTHKLSDYRGKTVFLDFWATWCPPCRGEMPRHSGSL
jgi:Thiol-disulfide isomerase and thioredoxins